MFTITEENIEKYTNISLFAIIGASQSEKKCPDCGNPLQFKLDYFLLDETIIQRKKQYLICDCDDCLWLNFNKVSDFFERLDDDTIHVDNTEKHKWSHELLYPDLFQFDNYRDNLEAIFVKISIKDISVLSKNNFCFLEDYFESKIGNGQHEQKPHKWYYKIVSDAIELGIKIETLPLLLCKTFASQNICMNWPIKNTIQEIVRYNPSKFNELITLKFESSCIAIRRILGGKHDKNSITIHAYNKKFIKCSKIENRINDYISKYENVRKGIINKCIAHCDEKEYLSRSISGHEDFMRSVAYEDTSQLCEIYNDYILKCIEDMNKLQKLNIKCPYKITAGSITQLSPTAEYKLIEMLRDTDKEITRMKEYHQGMKRSI